MTTLCQQQKLNKYGFNAGVGKGSINSQFQFHTFNLIE
jgi:hypothetical protein